MHTYIHACMQACMSLPLPLPLSLSPSLFFSVSLFLSFSLSLHIQSIHMSRYTCFLNIFVADCRSILPVPLPTALRLEKCPVD